MLAASLRSVARGEEATTSPVAVLGQDFDTQQVSALWTPIGAAAAEKLAVLDSSESIHLALITILPSDAAVHAAATKASVRIADALAAAAALVMAAAVARPATNGELLEGAPLAAASAAAEHWVLERRDARRADDVVTRIILKGSGGNVGLSDIV